MIDSIDDLTSETVNQQLLDLVECISIYSFKVEKESKPYCMLTTKECIYQEKVNNKCYCNGGI